MSNKLTQIAREALVIEADLTYRLDYSGKHRPTLEDFEIHIFEQVWGSTTFGFSGIGGQAITTANTWVFVPVGVNQKCFVYFGGRFAYKVDGNEKFKKDLANQRMSAVNGSSQYNN